MTTIAPARMPMRRSSAVTYGYFTAGAFVFVTGVLGGGVETTGVFSWTFTGGATGAETAGCLIFFFFFWSALPYLGFFGI